jgi:glycogen operon protein
MRTASGTPRYAALEYAIFAVFNAGPATEVVVPQEPPGQIWCLQIDTAHPDTGAKPVHGGTIAVTEESVVVLVLEKSA